VQIFNATEDPIVIYSADREVLTTLDPTGVVARGITHWVKLNPRLIDGREIPLVGSARVDRGPPRTEGGCCLHGGGLPRLFRVIPSRRPDRGRWSVWTVWLHLFCNTALHADPRGAGGGGGDRSHDPGPSHHVGGSERLERGGQDRERPGRGTFPSCHCLASRPPMRSVGCHSNRGSSPARGFRCTGNRGALAVCRSRGRGYGTWSICWWGSERRATGATCWSGFRVTSHPTRAWGSRSHTVTSRSSSPGTRPKRGRD